MPRQVADIEVEEIHLVDSPANKRKFLLMKSQDPDAASAALDETEEEKAEREKLEAEAKAKEEADAAEAKLAEEKLAEEKAAAEAKALEEKAVADKVEADALKGPAPSDLSPELVEALATVSPEARAEVEAALSKAHLSPEAEKARRIVMADLLMQMRTKIDDIFEMLSKSQAAKTAEAEAQVKVEADAAEVLRKSQAAENEVPSEAVDALEAIAKSMPSDETMKDLARMVKARAYV